VEEETTWGVVDNPNLVWGVSRRLVIIQEQNWGGVAINFKFLCYEAVIRFVDVRPHAKTRIQEYHPRERLVISWRQKGSAKSVVTYEEIF